MGDSIILPIEPKITPAWHQYTVRVSDRLIAEFLKKEGWNILSKTNLENPPSEIQDCLENGDSERRYFTPVHPGLKREDRRNASGIDWSDLGKKI